MDKISFELLAQLISATGIFSSLWTYAHPGVRRSYWGTNPHIVKQEIVDGTVRNSFIAMAMIGFGLQALSVIFEDALPVPRWPTFGYLLAVPIGIVFAAGLTFLVSKLARIYARPKVRRALGKLYAKHLGYLAFMLAIESKYAVAYSTKEAIPAGSEESSRSANQKSAERMLRDVEDLLEIKVGSASWKDRFERLEKYLAPYYDPNATEEE